MAMFAAIGFGADLTGAWSGPMQMTRNGETKDDSAHFVLTQKGTEVTGSVGPNADKQLPITKGSIEGSDAVLEAASPDGAVKIVIKVKLEGEKLNGDLSMSGPEGEAATGKLSLARVK